MNDNLIPENKKAIIMMVGAPACGKSTWAKNFSQKINAVYVSTDEIRAQVGKGEEDQSVNPQVFAIALSKVQKALSMGRHVVVDATNINSAARKTFLKPANEHDAYKIAVAFEVPREELVRRDAERNRHVGPEVIDKFLNKYQRPTEEEFDKIVIKHQ